MVTLNMYVSAHCPAFGVKVYVPDVVFEMTDGDQVPVILLSETVGKVCVVAPLQ